MYRSCIFCAAPLGSNDSVERFPVGRSLAFDAARGRLWAVCPGCARWNLAPIEERWEAVEDAERIFRDTRLRVQSENVGLAKLADGTRLVRVGKALPGELAVWRYGRIMLRRRAIYGAMAGIRTGYGFGMVLGAGVVTASAGVLVTGSAVVGVGCFALSQLLHTVTDWRPRVDDEPLLRYTGIDANALSLQKARFAFTFHGEVSVELQQQVPAPYQEEPGQVLWRDEPVVLPAEHARTLLRRGTVRLNAPGASRRTVQTAIALLAARGSAEDFLRRAAAERMRVDDPAVDGRLRRVRMLAVEMAVHDELERDALRGDLAALEEAWREAEQIAAIADRLPDVDPEPPRLAARA
ncbi:hypothetical protein [Longimicrobium sp.]|uniref:hypothetical protein n=1 Tax=Longimicrobium sp. TaxID=2029185 RepID=UPI003B3B41F7